MMIVFAAVVALLCSIVALALSAWAVWTLRRQSKVVFSRPITYRFTATGHDAVAEAFDDIARRGRAA